MANKEDTPLSGAEAKLATAQKMREDKLRASRAIKDDIPSQLIPYALIYVLATAFAFFLTDGPFMAGIGINPTGVDLLDRLLVGPGIPSLTGSADTDRLLVILLRGGAFFLLAAIIPFLSRVILRTFTESRITIYTATLAAVVFLPIFWYIFGGLAINLITELIRGF